MCLANLLAVTPILDVSGQHTVGSDLLASLAIGPRWIGTLCDIPEVQEAKALWSGFMLLAFSWL